MAMQYQHHAGNALSAIDSGHIDIARRQLDLAILAQRKRLRQRKNTTTVTASATTTAPESTPPQRVTRPSLPALPGKLALGTSRTQVFLVLMAWSLLCATSINHDIWHRPATAPTTPLIATSTSHLINGLPVQGRISSPIGWRTHPVTGQRSYHAGIDVAAPAGTPVKATGSGIVTFAGWRNNNCGNGVIINHGDVTTVYCHLGSISDGIKPGATVQAGNVLGGVGKTGRATGNHVHYEVQTNGKAPQQQRSNQTRYWNLINASAQEFGLDPLLVTAVIWKESTFNPNAVSGSDARGLMQLLPTTAAEVARKLKMPPPDLYDPATNIRLGSKYLADLKRQFGNSELALAAYNAGPGAVRKHKGIPPYPETQHYVTSIVKYYSNLKKEA